MHVFPIFALYLFQECVVEFYFRLIFEPAYFPMERKMMLGIKERAEATANSDEENDYLDSLAVGYPLLLAPAGVHSLR
jgi:hypothetical protein